MKFKTDEIDAAIEHVKQAAGPDVVRIRVAGPFAAVVSARSVDRSVAQKMNNDLVGLAPEFLQTGSPSTPRHN